MTRINPPLAELADWNESPPVTVYDGPTYVICRYMQDGPSQHRSIGTTTLRLGTTETEARARLAGEMTALARGVFPGSVQRIFAHLMTY